VSKVRLLFNEKTGFIVDKSWLDLRELCMALRKQKSYVSKTGSGGSKVSTPSDSLSIIQ